MAATSFFKRLRLDGFLSFAPGTAPFEMAPLNVLIGPNGSGKSNLIEAFEMLSAVPADLAQAIREGGGPGEWLWKGKDRAKAAEVEATIGSPHLERYLRYRLRFTSASNRVEVLDEAIEDDRPEGPDGEGVDFYYRFQRGSPEIRTRTRHGTAAIRHLQRDTLAPDQSVLSQRKDPELYPEVTWVGSRFGAIRTFREWSFGRHAPIRQAQRADVPGDRLLPDARNLALVLNRLEHRDGRQLYEAIRRFLPRFERLTTPVFAGSIQFYLHERGVSEPVPPARLSDGTIRFLALVALLLDDDPPPLLCIEEPELGLHPDAVVLMAELLVEASQRMQIVVTTHSDAMVSALTSHAGSVVVCENFGGGTVLERLDPERLAHWLDRYKLGEIWRIGELGGNP